MVKLKTILDTRRPKSDGTYPVMFRITNHKQVNYLSFGVSVTQAQWDDKSGLMSQKHPNAKSINASLSKRFYEIQKAILKLDDDENFSIDTLKDLLVTKTQQPVKPTTFLTFSQQVINDLILVKRTGNGLVYQTAVNRLISYCDNPEIKFSDINYSFLDNFKNQLLQEGIKKNTIGNYLRSIRS
ncbi:MAG: phage integrase SAM-like domain and Arm DNA-binding domain-containing protein [Mucilaginibacter sp.]